MNKKNILIVGGTGFIGYHLAKKAIQKKLIVTSISTKPAKKIRYLKKVKYIICDISHKKKLTKVIKKEYDYMVYAQQGIISMFSMNVSMKKQKWSAML